MFEIALLNPLRFIDLTDINSGFDGNFAVNQSLDFQAQQCYYQKWQTSDVLKLQILSDFVPTDLIFYDYRTGLQVANASWGEISTTIVGFTFKVYELTFAFSALPEGRYYSEFSYTDENNNLKPQQSEGFELKANQPNTILLKYKNSENNFDVIFNTGIEFQFRCESAISDFDPKNLRNVYTDQTVNPTQLSSVPYRWFTFYVGFGTGVPPWVLDKVNTIQSVDQVSYNNIYYQVVPSVDYTLITEYGTYLMGATVTIQQSNNNFNKYVNQPNSGNDEIEPMGITNRNFGVSSDLAIAGIFKAYTDLEKICINKRSAAAFTLLIGTTAGGSDIATFTVDQPENVFTIEWLFGGTATLYLTGTAGQDTDVFICYKQLDQLPTPVNPTPSGSTEGKGSAKVYHEITSGDLGNNFNLATGLGLANTPFEGWAWADGRNGTPNWTKRIPMMMDQTDINWDTTKLGTPIGALSFTLSKAQLPEEPLTIRVSQAGGGWKTSGGSGQPISNVGGIGFGDAAQVGKTDNMGTAAAISLIPNASIEIWIIKITD